MFELSSYNNNLINWSALDLFDEFFSSNESAHFKADISFKDNIYTIEAELPGFNKDEINIDIKEDLLTVSASHEKASEGTDNKYIRKERYMGTYSRTFDITSIDTDNIKASYNNGILTLELPKKEKVNTSIKLEIE